MMMIDDHPDIKNPPETEQEFPICPNCYEEADAFFRTRGGDIVGCVGCIDKIGWDEV